MEIRIWLLCIERLHNLSAIAVRFVSNCCHESELLKVHMRLLKTRISYHPNAFILSYREPQLEKDVVVKCCEVTREDLILLDGFTYLKYEKLARGTQILPSDYVYNTTRLELTDCAFDCFRQRRRS